MGALEFARWPVFCRHRPRRKACLASALASPLASALESALASACWRADPRSGNGQTYWKSAACSSRRKLSRAAYEHHPIRV